MPNTAMTTTTIRTTNPNNTLSTVFINHITPLSLFSFYSHTLIVVTLYQYMAGVWYYGGNEYIWESYFNMKRMNLENLPYWQENPAWINEDTEGYRITDRDIYFGDDYKELYHFRIDKSRFHDGFRGRHLVKVQFFNCDFSNMQFESATLLKVEFNQCNLTGTEFSKMNMKSVMFNECKMMFNNFTECKFKNIEFNDIMFIQLFLNQNNMKYMA